MTNFDKISCSLCLDLLKDPVTTSCGHSYCRICIEDHWDTEDQRGVHSCPQCREIFKQRPDLKKNTMLAELVEELKKIGLQAAPVPDHCYAGAEDVACDVCTGRQLKAQKSCLQCLISFCEEHLQPHFSPAYETHKLVEPSKKLQENICSRHNEVMKMFCRSDQQSICYLCPVDQHKGHDMVTAAAERTERQRELQGSRLHIQERIQENKKVIKLLELQMEAITISADKAVENSEKIFTELIRLLEQRCSDVKQQLRSQQEAEVSGVKELQEKLEQEITELKRKDQELEKLSFTEDHNQFLQDYPSLSQLGEPPDTSCISERPLRYFEGVTEAVSELRGILQDVLRGIWTTISKTETQLEVLLPEPGPITRADFSRYSPETQLEVLLPEPEPRTRADFSRYSLETQLGVLLPEPEPMTRAESLWYSRNITLDPNTANKRLFLSDRNRKVTLLSEDQLYPDHPNRFSEVIQVLSKESLTGRCYWEVELRGGVCLAVSYKTIRRNGRSNKCVFGGNNKSWALYCHRDRYVFWYNNIRTDVSGPRSSRVGVDLDHRAGILSFYSVSDTMTLLSMVQTTFTKPLHAGLGIYSTLSSAEFCQLK